MIPDTILDEVRNAIITSPQPSTRSGDSAVAYGIVKVNRGLGKQKAGIRTKHIEIKLPLGSSYRSGDYMMILPVNDCTTVRRVLKRFDLSPNDKVSTAGILDTFSLTGGPISVLDLLTTYLELRTAISQGQIVTLIDSTPPTSRERLAKLLADDTYEKYVLSKRSSILDILEKHPECELSFADYIDMIEPIKAQRYNISSAPAANIKIVPTTHGMAPQLKASLTYHAYSESVWPNTDSRFFDASLTYLAGLDPGDRVRFFIRSADTRFRLPINPTTPIILVCADIGLAAMRGFIQERAIIRKAHRITLGPAILYFGCEHHREDYIYQDELTNWEVDGVVSVRPCFSRVGPLGCYKYIPDRMWAERKELAFMFLARDVRILMCGSAGKLTKSVADVCKNIWLSSHGQKTEQDSEMWFQGVKVEHHESHIL
ncbi:hypothetical protein E8E12_001724 [Didymella heteroderae]|uniref:Sulfite reductase [NADPH] flavoprotein alpha-component-like FAD-binding domain-containing protein n=1 Tax=Didymella heteroderae TaxID=1769908 RepID=A0A9P4WG59_9PLEO|nr:hypothetical protein E8E12_001724 [Didymella heteroderae]